MNQLAMAFPAALHRKVRHRKAVEATERADADTPNWSQQAFDFLVAFAAMREGEFLTEEVISRSRGIVPEPADRKAWGSVILKAVRCGVIRRAGYSRNTRNASPKPTWRRA